ncbi:hypothetical protein LEMLEM_LOCUS23098 [Lemmus lemmus]
MALLEALQPGSTSNGPITSVAPPLSATTNTESIPGIETAEGLHSPRRMVAVKLANGASSPDFQNQQFLRLATAKTDECSA